MAHKDKVIAIGSDHNSIIFEDVDAAAKAFNVKVDTIRSKIYNKKGKPFRGYCLDYYLEVWDAAGD